MATCVPRGQPRAWDLRGFQEHKGWKEGLWVRRYETPYLSLHRPNKGHRPSCPVNDGVTRQVFL